MKALRLCVPLLVMLMPALAYGQADIPLLTMAPQEDGSNSYSLSLQVLLLMTALTLLPAAMLAMTSFTRIVVVLAILRQALGTAQTPSNQIILGLALFQTFKDYDFLQCLVYALGAGAGFILAIVLMAGLREKLELNNLPSITQGAAISLMIGGLLSLSFMGFAGLGS